KPVVHKTPMPSAQEQTQSIPTTNISQGKDQKGSANLHTEGSQPSSKLDGGNSSSSTSGTQTVNAQKELFLKEKFSVISSLVQKSITYPLLARKMGWEGRVVVCFRLTPDGRLEDLHVLESSGYEILDRSALEAVSRSAHLFPKPPVEVLIKLPVNFRLE
ncbi:MAG: energy transducer TonB, partial [Hydrogenobacter sp.]